MSGWSGRFQTSQRWRASRGIVVIVYYELLRTRAFTIAAAVAFYFVLALVPLLIVFSSLLGFLHMPNLFGQLLDLMALLVPPDAMNLVQRIMATILAQHRGGLLSFGVLGYLWASSGGFSSMIEALDIAYDTRRCRPWWRDRLQALLLTFTSGGLVLVALLAVIAEPRFGHMLTLVFPIPREFGHLWPLLRPVLTFVTFLSAVVLLYKLGPNSRHSLLSTLPGAIFAVFAWFGGSAGFTFYVSHFAHYNTMYGSLGAVIVLMLWFYIIGLAVLIGAELNAELLKGSRASESAKQGSPLVNPAGQTGSKSSSGVPAA
jgi:membrane protein